MSKRDELLSVALKLFAEEGYESVGVQKIADSADVKKPTLYHYFGSKEGVLDAILAEKFTLFIEELEELTKYKGDIVFSIENIVYHYMKFAKSDPLFYRMVLNLNFSPEQSLSYSYIIKYMILQHNFIEKMFNEAEKQHGNMKGRSRMYTFTFIGMINSAISFYFYTKDENDISIESARKVSKQFMYGIFSWGG